MSHKNIQKIKLLIVRSEVSNFIHMEVLINGWPVVILFCTLIGYMSLGDEHNEAGVCVNSVTKVPVLGQPLHA